MILSGFVVLSVSLTQKVSLLQYSVRTPDWRYTEWAWWDGKRLVGDFSREAPGIELYSHRGDTESDFDLFENENLAYKPEHASVIKAMHQLVIKQWQKQ